MTREASKSCLSCSRKFSGWTHRGLSAVYLIAISLCCKHVLRACTAADSLQPWTREKKGATPLKSRLDLLLHHLLRLARRQSTPNTLESRYSLLSTIVPLLAGLSSTCPSRSLDQLDILGLPRPSVSWRT